MSFAFVTAPLESQIHHGVESPLHVLDTKPVPKLTGMALKTLTVTLLVELPRHGDTGYETYIGATVDETKAATAAAMEYLYDFVAANTDAIMATGQFFWDNDTHFDFCLGLFTTNGNVVPQKYDDWGLPMVPPNMPIWPDALTTQTGIDFDGGGRFVHRAICSSFISSIAPVSGGRYGPNFVQARVTWMLFYTDFQKTIAIYRDGYSAPIFCNWIDYLFSGPYKDDLNWPAWIGTPGTNPDAYVETLKTGAAPADVSGVPFGQFLKIPFPPNTGWNACTIGPHYTDPYPTIAPGVTVYQLGECYYPNNPIS